MDKILIEITNKEILFSYCNKNITDITKLEEVNSLVLTENIIKENHKQISKYLSKKNINAIAVTHISLIKVAVLLTYHYPIYETLIIKENAPLTKDIAITLMHPSIKYKTIKCHSLPKEAKNLLEQKDLTIITTNSLPFESTLMLKNNFKTYNDIEEKETLTIDFPLNKYDLEDFNEFLKTNKNLKTIELKHYNYNYLEKLIKILNQNNKQKITINIYEKNENVFLDLSDLKKLKKKYKIKLKIIYSKEYIQKNRKKQIIKSIITLLLIIIIIVTTIYLLSFPYNKNKNQKLKNKIIDVKENIEVADGTKETETAYTKKYSKILEELKKINNETVGWLTVNNTNIDYPVVKHDDNDYYLKHDFEKNPNIYGWIFMDYRNNPNAIDQNTIIYGHDSAGVMFASLYKTIKKSWYQNKQNQIITLNTEKEGKYQIFSLYKIKSTNDYLITTFPNNSSHIEFLTKIKNRSIYNFQTNVNENDKILTLSTCYGNEERLVIHAKKIS